MRRIFLVVCCVLGSCVANAQFFDFDFFSPFSSQREPREQITGPQYKGGNEKLNEYIRKHYKNPAQRENVTGKIVVYCVISEKGKVIDAKLKNALQKKYDDEALRIVKKLKFKPAMQGKKKIKSRLDIVFPIRNGRLSFSKLNTVEV